MLGFLMKGISPGKLAWAIGWGVAIAIFPVFGSTTLICALVAFIFRLNMPAIQLSNYFSYPLQFILFLPYMRFGEYIFNAPPMPFSVPQIFGMFKEDIILAISVLWTSTWHAIIAWLLTAPFAAVVLHLILTPVFKKVLNRKRDDEKN